MISEREIFHLLQAAGVCQNAVHHNTTQFDYIPLHNHHQPATQGTVPVPAVSALVYSLEELIELKPPKLPG